MVGREVDQVTLAGNALAIHDVEFRLPEWRRDLVFDHLDARSVADHTVAVLYRAYPADIQPNARVKLQRFSARGRFRRAKEDTDLFAELIDEDECRPGT